VTSRGVLRVFGVCIVVLWALLITVWLTAHTIVAADAARRSWRELTWRRAAVVTDTSLTIGDTALTDTMATDTAWVLTETTMTTTGQGSAREALAKIRAEEAAKRAAPKQAE
jgi:hypothetical protein